MGVGERKNPVIPIEKSSKVLKTLYICICICIDRYTYIHVYIHFIYVYTDDPVI